MGKENSFNPYGDNSSDSAFFVWVRAIFDLLLFPIAVAQYLLTGKTPPHGHQTIRRLYSFTNGSFQRVVSFLLEKVHGRYHITSASGILGNLDSNQIQELRKQIEKDGLIVFPNRFPKKSCEELVHFALVQDCFLIEDIYSRAKPVRYNREHPLSARYQIIEPKLLTSPLIQNLVTDLSLLSVAEAYLKIKPAIAIVTMWWSTAFSNQPNSMAAQLFHFDMDQLKFLKLFIYLTDVNANTGPHCFVKGSHHKKPRPLCHARRFTDEEILKYYRSDDIVEIDGPQGTVFAADTVGFHKGRHLQNGERLMFQIEYVNCLFGGPLEWCKLQGEFAEKIKLMKKQFPRTYTRYS